MEPIERGLGRRNRETELFLRKLAEEYGVTEQTEWHNNNNTLKRKAYVIDVDSISKKSKLGPKDIIEKLFNYNKTHGTDLSCVPVAGWSVPSSGLFGCGDQVLREYAQSFSLNPEMSPEGADIILRMSNKAQKMKIKKDKITGEEYLRVSGNVRVTDSEAYMASLRKPKAFNPKMPTLHPCSLAGAAGPGCYGPSRDHGPMTTDIIELDIITATGEYKKLSAKENPELFKAFRDGHLGAVYIRKMSFRITDDYTMKREDTLMQDVNELKNTKDNYFDKEHTLFMYIPVGINEEDNHSPRIRVTTFEKVSNDVKRTEPSKFCDDLATNIKLNLTEAGEVLIDPIVTYPELRPFYPLVLEAAVAQTYGTEKHKTTVGGPSSLHVFKTYTDLGLEDDNWMIKVKDTQHAREVLEGLMDRIEPELKRLGKEHIYPLFNVFARLQGGVHYPEGRAGINSATIDEPGQKILSFELLTYSALSETSEFKNLQMIVEGYLAEKGLKREFHPGKNRPAHIKTMLDILTDNSGRKGLENFQNALIQTHINRENLKFSPLFTAIKRKFVGLEDPVEKEKQRAEKENRADHKPEYIVHAQTLISRHSARKEEKRIEPVVHKAVLKKLHTIGIKKRLPKITALAQVNLNQLAVMA